MGLDAETIVARATAPGASAVAVVRMSGPRALKVLVEVFRPARARWEKVFSDRRPHLGSILGWGGEPIDTGLVIVNRGPRSYTGEDVVEFHLHGSDVLCAALIRQLVGAGCRVARPGEFTRRAFVHGKMDLGQAEAVMALIAARSEAAASAAQRMLAGELGDQLATVREGCLEVLKWLEMTIDFPEEDEELGGDEETLRRLDELLGMIESLQRACRAGEVLRLGLKIVFSGAPNVGKSSLFNRLLGAERALVTAIPGTTRDILEGELRIEGGAAFIQDTAGLRESTDEVERLGISRAERAAAAADIRVHVLDGGRTPGEMDIEKLKSMRHDTDIVVINKVDKDICPELIQTVQQMCGEPLLVSALTGQGIQALEAALRSRVAQGPESEARALIVSRWQLELIDGLRPAILSAREGVLAGHSAVASAEHLYEALTHLDEITGRDARSDLLDRVFRDFCLGK